jgi:hypothetical protein
MIDIVERIAQRAVELLQTKSKPKPKPARLAPAPPRELSDLEKVQREVAFQRKHGRWGTIW